MMKSLYLSSFFIIFNFLSFNAQTNAPTDSEKERMERKMEERKQEYINNFLSTLDADDFQKEIISQKLVTFFERKIALSRGRFNRSIEFQEALRKLEESHFTDIEPMLTEDTMVKIKEMIKGDFDEKEVVKKKKKEKKTKKN